MKLSELVTDFLEYLEIEPMHYFLMLRNLIVDYSAQEVVRGECQPVARYAL